YRSCSRVKGNGSQGLVQRAAGGGGREVFPGRAEHANGGRPGSLGRPGSCRKNPTRRGDGTAPARSAHWTPATGEREGAALLPRVQTQVGYSGQAQVTLVALRVDGAERTHSCRQRALSGDLSGNCIGQRPARTSRSDHVQDCPIALTGVAYSCSKGGQRLT